MPDDQLKRSLEELFSDLSAPTPEAEAELLPPPSPPVKEPPLEPETEPLPPPSPPVKKPPPEPEAEPLPPPSPPVKEPPPEPETEPLPTKVLAGPPAEEKAAVRGPDQLEVLRERIINIVLRSAAILGLPALIAWGAYVIPQNDWAGLAINGALYSLLLVITFVRTISFQIRAGVILTMVYGLGLLSLLDSGLSGDGPLYLISLPVLATILLGRRSGIGSLVLSLGTLVVVGWATVSGRLTPLLQVHFTQPVLWLSVGIVFLILAAAMLLSHTSLVSGLEQVLARSEQLTTELQISKGTLEQQVAERTRELEESNRRLQRHATQLRASAQVGHAATSILDVDELLRTTVDLIRDEFGFYHASVFLIDETGEWAVLQEATGEVGQQMKAQGHRLTVGGRSMVGWAAAYRQPRIALDVGKDAVHFDNPLLPHTRSEMTLPLVVGERLMGVLDVQSTEEAAFDEEDVRTLRIMADQIAVAIDNARKFSDKVQLLEMTSPIYRASRRLTTATTTDEVADAIIASVAETGADGCVMVEFEFSPTGEFEALLYRGVWRRDREPQFQAGMRLPIAESPFPPEMVSTLWAVTDAERDERLPQSARQVFEATDARALSNIPLRTREGVIGQVVVIRTTPVPFSDAALRLYEMLSDQASVALERARLFEESRARAEELAVLNEMGRALTAMLDVDAVIENIHRYTSRLMDTTNFYVAMYHPQQDEVSFPLYAEGEQIRRLEEPRRAAKGLTEYVIRRRESLLVTEDTASWVQQTEEVEHIGELAKSWLGVPMMIGERVIGVIAAQSYTTARLYNEHHRDLLSAVASHAAIAIENARLFEETQRRAEHERLVSEITARVRRPLDVDTILRVSLRELGTALGASEGLVRLGISDGAERE